MTLEVTLLSLTSPAPLIADEQLNLVNDLECGRITTSFHLWIMETLVVMNLLGGEVMQMNKLTTKHLEDKYSMKK